MLLEVQETRLLNDGLNFQYPDFTIFWRLASVCYPRAYLHNFYFILFCEHN